MGDKIKMDIKHTDSIILNLFHNASTERRFIYVGCFHGLKTTVFKEMFYFDFQMKKLMKRLLFSRVPRYTLYTESDAERCLGMENIHASFGTRNFFTVFPKTILSLNTEEHVCVYIYIYICVCVCVCAGARARARAHIAFST
jgi:hypothetical protein